MARRPKPWYREAREAWFVTLGGVQHNLGPDKKEAYERFFALMRQPQPRKVAPESLLAVIDAYLDWTKKNRSSATYEWYQFHLQRFADRYPDLRLSDLRPFHVQQWMDSYDISLTSKRNHGRAVKRCLRWARRQGYIELNPIADLELPSAESREVCISEADFERLLGYVQDEAFRDLLITTWETGCRPQESLRVEAQHVDLRHQRWVFPKSKSKGKRKSRVVYLTDAALDITRRLLLKNPTGPLFRNSNGRPWHPFSVNCGFTRARIRWGKAEMVSRGLCVSADEVAVFARTLSPTRRSHGRVVRKTDAELRCEAKCKLTARLACQLAPRFSLYALRHSWATHALQRGIDAVTVAVLMGHSDPSMLARVYQHLSHDPGHLLAQAKRAAG
jgi:integrase